MYEQRRRFPYLTDRRPDVGGAKLSQHSTDQQGQRTRTPRFFRESEKHRSRRRLKSERLSTRAIQHVPHRSRKHATGVDAQIRADRGVANASKVEPSVQQPEVSTLVAVDAREINGSARSRLSYGGTRSRKSAKRMVQQWHVKNQTWKEDPDA